MKQSPLQKQKLGKLGEDIAADFLRAKKFILLDRNFRHNYGELDIIALDGPCLVFVEVKTRTDDSFGLPEEAVTPGKLREIIKVAAYYVSTHEHLPSSQRIDVVAITLTDQFTVSRLYYIPNVTG